MTDSGSTVRDSVLSTIGTIAQGASRFAYTVIIGRLLGADVLAATNTAFAVSILLSLLGPTAAGNAAAAFGGAGPTGQLTTRKLTAMMVWLSALLGLVALVTAHLLGSGGTGPLMVGALTISWSWYIFGRGVRFGMRQVPAVAVWDTVTGALSIVLLVSVIFAQSTPLVLAPAVIGYGAFAVASLVSARRAASRRDGDERSASPQPLAHFLIWSSLGLIATNGIMQVSMVFAAVFDSPARAGLFAAALALATPLSMLAQAVTPALLPRFAQWSQLPGSARTHSIRRATLALTALLGTGAVVVITLLPWVLPLVFGQDFAGAVPLAQGLMVAVFGFSLSVFLSAYLAAIGRARMSTVATGACTLFGLMIMLAVSIGFGGAIGAVIGTGSAMILSASSLAAISLRPGKRESVG
jgi:O-antigen/teichoic acid export membrane protein